MEAKVKNIHRQIQIYKSKLKAEMPRIKKEIQIYEEKVAKGLTTKSPPPSPQFNNG
ncbi:hypothetical protein KIH41_14180 [Litoribacter ruber]|uniref:Uncharacterized protein n=1 Tax=Litoribacter ruber TaxID=702568 RepID=A0AAP2CF87_9BACT|nr:MULTISPECIES: hypothetical protein [Litoribacter]MBS9523443.1 hypothetical protein [Litoribacter alkaliphilus]MBT0812431.1 hypothetical protein [Litoribacter ruber]